MKELICISYSGLADRIMMLLAGRELAARANWKFTFIWPINTSCAASFNAILRTMPGFQFAVDHVGEDYAPGVPFLHAHDMPWPEVQEVVNNWTHSDKLKLCAYPKQFDMEDFGQVIDFSFPVQTQASEFAMNHFDDGTIGVHIRARDMADQTPLIGDYEFKVRQLREKTNGKVFLATDCPIVRKWFTSVVPDVVTFPSRTFDRSRPEATIDAAIELALLRKCKRLVLSGYSGFSRMALTVCVLPVNKVIAFDYT